MSRRDFVVSNFTLQKPSALRKSPRQVTHTLGDSSGYDEDMSPNLVADFGLNPNLPNGIVVLSDGLNYNPYPGPNNNTNNNNNNLLPISRYNTHIGKAQLDGNTAYSSTSMLDPSPRIYHANTTDEDSWSSGYDTDSSHEYPSSSAESCDSRDFDTTPSSSHSPSYHSSPRGIPNRRVRPAEKQKPSGHSPKSPRRTLATVLPFKGTSTGLRVLLPNEWIR